MKKLLYLILSLSLISCFTNSLRISSEKRTFVSDSVDAEIKLVAESIADQKLRIMFEKCYPNTLDTTVEAADNGRFYIITGDIPAMWLRDSSAQVFPFIKFVGEDARLKTLVRGLALNHIDSILIDPYANAFLKDRSAFSKYKSDTTQMLPGVFERKWEIDSLCYSIDLLYEYVSVSSDESILDENFVKACSLILDTFVEQQRKIDKGPYFFMRKGSDALSNQVNSGFGREVAGNGLICSAFRPSDDATDYLYLIPSNLFAVKSLKNLSRLLDSVSQKGLSARSAELAAEVEAAVYEYGVYNHPKYGEILAYEVDGLGNYNLMDDANVPSLLALPFLELIEKDSDIYQNTRRFVLSSDNPWYFEGKAGKGIGSPHTGRDTIWPMSIIMQAFTASSEEEVEECLRMLINTDGGTGFMHESFHKNNDKSFSRAWFSWANTLFGSLIVNIYENYPALLDKAYSSAD
ncbi:MAG: glycoside hydrolase family 125 protein [Spirochaetales bacterium]|nr:glycoside hydrolase family 125 protein [Spirochaetales bacterium]